MNGIFPRKPFLDLHNNDVCWTGSTGILHCWIINSFNFRYSTVFFVPYIAFEKMMSGPNLGAWLRCSGKRERWQLPWIWKISSPAAVRIERWQWKWPNQRKCIRTNSLKEKSAKLQQNEQQVPFRLLFYFTCRKFARENCQSETTTTKAPHQMHVRLRSDSLHRSRRKVHP